MALNASLAHPSLLVLYLVSSLAAGCIGFSSTARMASVPALVETQPHPAANAIIADHLPGRDRRRPGAAGLLLGIGLPLVYCSTPPPSWSPWSPPS